MAITEAQRARYIASRFAPEYRHLPAVMAELGWRTGNPTDVQRLPRVFFKMIRDTRWEVKRSPQGKWRIRHGRGVVVCTVGWIWQYQWYTQAPTFDNPVAAVLWFERIGTTLLKHGIWSNENHVRG